MVITIIARANKKIAKKEKKRKRCRGINLGLMKKVRGALHREAKRALWSNRRTVLLRVTDSKDSVLHC